MIKSKDGNWHLRLDVRWIKSLEDIKCPTCNGTGETGGGPFSIGDPEPCNKCYGRRTIAHPDLTYPPELPEEFIKRLHDVFDDYAESINGEVE